MGPDCRELYINIQLKSDKMNDKIPLVSIIIPTYNSGKTIKQCLQSISTQTYAHIEVLVIDGGSEDQTIEISQEYGIKIFIQTTMGMSEATNFGIKEANGKYIYRVDSDVILDANIVEECVHKCEIEKYDGVALFWSPDPTISFWAKVRKLEKDCYKDDLFPRGARFFRKDVIKSIGGFNQSLTAGEDYDVYNRLLTHSFKMGKVKSQETHIGEPKSMIEIIKKNYYYGKTFNHFLNHNRENGLKQMSPMRGPLLRNWKKFMIHPVLLIGFIIYEILVYSSSITGLIVSVIQKEMSRNSGN